MSSCCPPVERLAYCRRSSGLHQCRPLQEVIRSTSVQTSTGGHQVYIRADLYRKSSGLHQCRPLQEVIRSTSVQTSAGSHQVYISADLCRKSSGLHQGRPLQGVLVPAHALKSIYTNCCFFDGIFLQVI
ncbi:hypothetical protein KUCAC02_020481 [Chaenocephalus aceratus]|nr:hypothetical protein KUCAC02_020481 [Chaenocephalus aceratus]